MKANFKKFKLGSMGYQNTQVLAFHLYVSQGRPKGRAFDHWLEAEKQLKEHFLSAEEMN